MVVSLTGSLGDSLKNLLTSTQSQARNVAFNIRFAALQNTAIGRINKETAEAQNIDGRQRELDRINASIKSLTDRRNAVAYYQSSTEANQRNSESLALVTIDTLSKIDSGGSTLSSSEVSAFNSSLGDITDLANALIETNDPKFFDGDHPTKLRGIVGELKALTPTEGVIDAEGSDTATNDNRQVIDLLNKLADSAGAASDTASTLNLMSKNVLSDIDRKLKKLHAQEVDVSQVQATQAELTANKIRTKYATFLQSVEVGFDSANQSVANLTKAMEQTPNSPSSVASVLSDNQIYTRTHAKGFSLLA